MIRNPVTPTGPWLRPTAPSDRAGGRRARTGRGRAARRPASRLFTWLALAGGLVGLTGACAELPLPDYQAPTEIPELRLQPVAFKDLPGWPADDLEAGLKTFLKSCPKIAKQDRGRPLVGQPEYGSFGDLQRVCADMAKLDLNNSVQVRFFVETRFQPYLVRDRQHPTGTFTGYYEPLLHGAWQPDRRYRYPILSRPKDIVIAELGDFDPDRAGQRLIGRAVGDKFVPYFERREIEAGALKGRQLELIWVDSPIDRFFLHVQGSGRVVLPDGGFVRLAFAGRNGRRYTSIGRELVARGALRLEDVSLQSLRAWLTRNPVAGQEIMARNKSYIFFRAENGPGPVGAEGVVLTPGRSLAVDKRFLPLGTPLWLDTTDPLDPKNATPLRRLVVAQDIGSAITGPVRGDLFWGFGQEAEARAGYMNEKGRYFALLPKP